LPPRRLWLILAIVGRDLRQIHRHGLPALLALTVLLLLMGVVLFSMVGGQFRKTGVPDWTGPVLTEGGGEGLSAEISADVLAGPAPLPVNFTSGVSGGTPPYSYSWNAGAGLSSDAPGPALTYPSAGSYECVLTVRDSTGENFTAPALRILVTDAAPVELRAAISVNRSEGGAPLSVAFRAAVAGGTPPYTFAWELGDGNTSALPSPAAVYGTPGERTASLVVRDSFGNTTRSNNITISAQGGGEGGLPFNLLDVVYGFCVLVTMFLVPAAFSAGYVHEMRKGTVRTLACYPVGVLEITAAKLVFAAIAGLALSLVAGFLPALGSMKPAGEVFGIFITAYALTMATVAVGALSACALTRFTKRMYLRPTSPPVLLVALSFLLTTGIVGGIFGVLKLLGMDIDPAGMVRSFMPLITLSPYHLGGAALSAALGGGGSPPYFVLVLPAVLLAAGTWMTGRVYPDIYEKE
jgi:hypothetical protein